MKRQGEKERTAHTGLGAVVELAAHELHQLMAEHQTQARAFFAPQREVGRRVAGAGEQVFFYILWNAQTGVADGVCSR